MLPIEIHQVAQLRHQERTQAARAVRPDWVDSVGSRPAERSVHLPLRARLLAWLATPLASGTASRKVNEPASANVSSTRSPDRPARLASRLFFTAIPVTDIWVRDTVALDDVAAAAHADVVHEGHNIVLRQAAGDAPLTFRKKVDEVWTANPFGVLLDLHQDPRRGREQADRLREEVISF